MGLYLKHWWQFVTRPWTIFWVGIVPLVYVGFLIQGANHRSLISVVEIDRDHSLSSAAFLSAWHRELDQLPDVDVVVGLADNDALQSAGEITVTLPEGFGSDGNHSNEAVKSSSRIPVRVDYTVYNDRVISETLPALRLLVTNVNPNSPSGLTVEARQRLPLKPQRLDWAVAWLVWLVAMTGVMSTLPTWVSDKHEGHHGPIAYNAFKATLVARVLTVWVGVLLVWWLLPSSMGISPQADWLRVGLVLTGVSLVVPALSVLAVGVATRIHTVLEAQLIATAWVLIVLALAHPGEPRVFSHDVESVVRWLPGNLLVTILSWAWWQPKALLSHWVEVLALLSWISTAACVGLSLIRFEANRNQSTQTRH